MCRGGGEVKKKSNDKGERECVLFIGTLQFSNLYNAVDNYLHVAVLRGGGDMRNHRIKCFQQRRRPCYKTKTQMSGLLAKTKEKCKNKKPKNGKWRQIPRATTTALLHTVHNTHTHTHHTHAHTHHKHTHTHHGHCVSTGRWSGGE